MIGQYEYSTHLDKSDASPLDAYVWGYGGNGILGLEDTR
jgi:hypothetical protein